MEIELDKTEQKIVDATIFLLDKEGMNGTTTKKIAKKDKQAAYVNYIMGLSFISEGAIPFASADPIRTIPAFVVGSAVTGALSMAFSCTLRAPHGGIFVIATIGHPLLYLVSILVGSLVAMGIMTMLKRNLPEYNKN